MDKPTRERTIIVNVNGEKKEYKWIPSEDPNTLDTIQEIASTVEEDQPSLWPVVEEKPAEKNEPKTKPAKKMALLDYGKLNKLKVLTAGIPVVIALILGTFFGVVILKIVLFGGGEQTVKVQESVPLIGSNKQVPQDEKKMVKDMNAFVVQGGVYSSKQAAEQRVSLIEGDGIPAIILEQEDKYFIYIGAAATLQDTKKLALLYRGKGVDTYWKEIRFQGQTKKAYTPKETEIIQNMIHNTNQYAELASYGLLQSNTKEKPDIKSINLENIPKELQNLHNLSESMNKTWSTYQSKPEETSLMQLQKCILQFFDEWYKL